MTTSFDSAFQAFLNELPWALTFSSYLIVSNGEKHVVFVLVLCISGVFCLFFVLQVVTPGCLGWTALDIHMCDHSILQLQLLGPRVHPASASWVARIRGACHCAQLTYFCFCIVVYTHLFAIIPWNSHQSNSLFSMFFW